METFAHHRKRTTVRPVYGLTAGDTRSASDYTFTAEQLLRLVWNAAGATMAAVGVPEHELLSIGQRLTSTLNEIVSEYGVTIPDGYR